MNAKEFFIKVSKMREAQKNYFSTRTQSNLKIAKSLEKEIDQEISRVNRVITEKKEPGLF